MLFNSYLFIFLFLPATLCIYFALNHLGHLTVAKIGLLLASLFFYSWWNPAYLPLLLGSILFNYSIANRIVAYGVKPADPAPKKRLLVIAIVANVSLLAFYKYMDFFIGNVNLIDGMDVPLLNLALPLAISFFTLQQIAFVIDSYRNVASERNFLDYSVFVSFFPQLISGPIVHHKEMMPQLAVTENKRFSFNNFNVGSFLFGIGLFKKVVLADSFAVWADRGFDSAESLTAVEAWVTNYSYTLQLYFDFSGYSDMAIGLALMFNIVLPLNFNSPYQARSIIDLWARWHLTLTRFVNAYIYRPMLRSRPGFSFSYAMFTSFFAMLVVGVWHGAAWTFVIFGMLHGVGIVVNHVWRRMKLKMPDFLAWLLAFHFFSLSLVIFRSTTWADVSKLYSALFGFGESGWQISKAKLFGSEEFWLLEGIGSYFSDSADLNATIFCVVLLAVFLAMVVLAPNSQTIKDRYRPTWRFLLFHVLLIVVPVMLIGANNKFIYFQF